MCDRADQRLHVTVVVVRKEGGEARFSMCCPSCEGLGTFCDPECLRHRRADWPVRRWVLALDNRSCPLHVICGRDFSHPHVYRSTRDAGRIAGRIHPAARTPEPAPAAGRNTASRTNRSNLGDYCPFAKDDSQTVKFIDELQRTHAHFSTQSLSMFHVDFPTRGPLLYTWSFLLYTNTSGLYSTRGQVLLYT